MTNIVTFDSQIDQIKKDGATGKDIKKYIVDKFNYYKTSPQGCIDYIQECLYVAVPGVGYQPFALWDTQKRMLTDIVECMFDNKKDMYVLLGSRQCGKTTCTLALSDWLTTFYTKYNVVLIHVDDKRGHDACEEFRKMRYEKTKFMYYKPIKNAVTHQIFQNNSSFQLQSTQKSKSGSDVDTGRGLSVNLLWVDEAGSVDIEKLESSIFPTTSTTFMFCKQQNIPHIILLSGTANGRVGIGKRFYDLWKAVEPPLNESNPYMGGYKLFWKDIPGKDEDWYRSLCAQMPMRKVHQEFDCVFYGTENSLFSDEQIVSIQNHSNELDPVEPNYIYTTPNGYVAKGKFFENIIRGKNYIAGIDTASGRGGDYTAIEIIDSETLEQVFELRDNHIQNDDLVKTINNIVLTFISKGANILLSIETNATGTAVISDLKALNPIYKTLIYRNTISADISKNSSDQPIDYYKCDHGVSITKGSGNKEGTRDLLINYIFMYINNNLNCIKSKELMQEIESLEINKDDKVVGNPHDDMVFALGHALLIKHRARKQNMFAIFRFCSDVRNDDSLKKVIELSLENYDDNTISDVLDSMSSSDILIGETGFIATARNNLDQYRNIEDQLANMPFALNRSLQSNINPSGTLDLNSLNMIREQIVSHTQEVREQLRNQKDLERKMKNKQKNPLVQKIMAKVTKKSKREKFKEEYRITNNIEMYEPQEDFWVGAMM